MKSLKSLTLLFTVALFAVPASTATATAASQPNIIVFLVDDMGVMDTSLPFLTGDDGMPKRYPHNDFFRTPNMERLAKNGIRFNQFYAQSVCSPTRLSIMTGQNAARHRCTQWISPKGNNRGDNGPPEWRWKGLAKGDVTLPGTLRGAGYKTIHVGKGHFGPVGSEGAEPLNLGFDVNVAGHAWGAPGSYYAKGGFGIGGTKPVPGLKKYHGSDIFLTEALTIEANAQVAKAVAEKKPFYLYLSHYAVHAPFNSDPRFAANYADSGKPKNAKAYATLIEGMDKSLGDVLDQVEELGVAENTLVIFLGDNGSDAPLGASHAVACAAPLRGKKGTHYEGGMRVPFIAAWAKRADENPHQKRLPIPAGAIQGQIAAVDDLFPTILDLLGIQAPKGHTFDGSTLSTLLQGKSDPKREESFLMHFPHDHRSDYFTSYRLGDWKLIYHYQPANAKGESRCELFNLKNDLSESNNLAGEKPEELKRLIAAMAAELENQHALYPVSKGGVAIKPKLP
jgi:arylsulfatase A-like enzyme